MKLLNNILVHRRSYQSDGEANFLTWWRQQLTQICDFTEDEVGNIIIRVGSDYSVCHSSHTDTVHNGRLPAMYQKIVINHRSGFISKPFGDVQCLGADDGAGLYIMYELIKAERPGLYIMHRGEERGGIGSHWLAKHTPDVLDGITHCIAYDRKGYDSVITHQAGGRCCSDDLAGILTDQLGYKLHPDPTGSFTDSACYTHLVPECTNLSVGYFRQHSPNETQDFHFLGKLTEALVAADLNGLPVHRAVSENHEGRWRRAKNALTPLTPKLPSAKLH